MNKDSLKYSATVAFSRQEDKDGTINKQKRVQYNMNVMISRSRFSGIHLYVKVP